MRAFAGATVTSGGILRGQETRRYDFLPEQENGKRAANPHALMAPKQCFIIAPLTTPRNKRKLYDGDADHFRHVIEGLIIPAVLQAGFEPKAPIAKGAELIHAEIVKNLHQAPLVLCDMSSLNPNVFFELGIRTALNKPVCLIRDDKTIHVPFDLSLINNHTYPSSMEDWVANGESIKLADHVKQSAAVVDNALWKYFALGIIAESSLKGENALLRNELAALRKALEDQKRKIEVFARAEQSPVPDSGEARRALLTLVQTIGQSLSLRISSLDVWNGSVAVGVDHEFPGATWTEFERRLRPFLPGTLANVPIQRVRG